MQLNLICKICEKLADCACNAATPGDLQEWLAPILWDIDKWNDPDAQSLAYSAELTLSEYHHGHLTDGELRTELADLVARHAPTSKNKVTTARDDTT